MKPTGVAEAASRRRVIARLLFHVAAPAAAVAWIGAAGIAIGDAQPEVTAAIDRYEFGDSGAVHLVAHSGFRVGSILESLDRWARRGNDEPRSDIAAAGFAVEIIWTAGRTGVQTPRRNLDPWLSVPPKARALADLSDPAAVGVATTWAIHKALPHVADERARLVVLAALGAMEDARSWTALRAVITEIEARMPVEPRVRMAEVFALVGHTLGSQRESPFGRFDVIRDERLPRATLRRIPAVRDRLDSVAAEVATLRPEVDLRIGLLDIRLRDWTRARQRLARASTTLEEPELQAAADYLLAWVLERLGDHAGAIAAYRRVIEVTPSMRDAATELAALLFVHGDRAEAYRIMERAFASQAPPQEFADFLDRGDAWRVPDWLSLLRAGLRTP